MGYCVKSSSPFMSDVFSGLAARYALCFLNEKEGVI